MHSLKTGPSFATAHFFCAPRDGQRISRFVMVVPLKKDIFTGFIKFYAVKADLGTGYWNPTENEN